MSGILKSPDDSTRRNPRRHSSADEHTTLQTTAAAGAARSYNNNNGRSNRRGYGRSASADEHTTHQINAAAGAARQHLNKRRSNRRSNLASSITHSRVGRAAISIVTFGRRHSSHGTNFGDDGSGTQEGRSPQQRDDPFLNHSPPSPSSRVSTVKSWDLEHCIAVIETLQHRHTDLTPEQMGAIQHLRLASIASVSNGDSRRSVVRKRRDAQVFGKDSPLMTKELLQCFKEVEGNVNDTAQQANVTAVLANYGGEVFSSISPLAHSLKIIKEEGKPCENGSPESLEKDDDDDDDEHDRRESLNPLDFESSQATQRRHGAAAFDPLTPSMHQLSSLESSYTMKVYCPPEWNALSNNARVELTNLLSWENLSSWDFNVLDVAEQSRKNMRRSSTFDCLNSNKGCPLLLVGWAILCAPMAQKAMEGSIEGSRHLLSDKKKETKKEFGDTPNTNPCYVDLDINPETVCNFLREIEGRYSSDIPYHNNTHAADVTQTLHCLLQFIGEDKLVGIWNPVDIFAILLAATFHDVGHPGANNLYQKNTRASLAIRYNDESILENMHSAVGHSLLMGDEKKEEWDVFKGWDDAQIEQARRVMVTSVLGTDMSNHFEYVGKLASLMEKVQSLDAESGSTKIGTEAPGATLSTLVRVLGSEDDVGNESLKKECTDLARFLLKLLLHAADISNPTKELDLAKYWAENALAEFFAQGKRLRALTTSLHSLLVILPRSFLISPLSNLLYL